MAKVPRATGHHFPPHDAKLSLRNTLVLSSYRGQPRIQTWPRKRGKPKSSTTRVQNGEFAAMARMVMEMSDGDRRAAMEIATGTPYTWRDVLSKTLAGRIILLDDGYLMDLQTALDELSTAIGALIIRTGAGWVALLPSEDGQVLTLTAGLPAWVDPQGSARSLELLVTGEIPAQFIVDPTGQLIWVPVE